MRQPIKLYSKTDLGERWGTTRQNVNNRRKRHQDFPTPYAVVESVNMELYALEDVLVYEKNHQIEVNSHESRI